MRNVIAIHTEPSSSNNLEHIAKLRYSVTDRAGQRGGNGVYEVTRQQMYDFVKSYPRQSYAISSNDDEYAFLEAVNNGHVQYVKTVPDSTRSDNLLSLPRF